MQTDFIGRIVDSIIVRLSVLVAMIVLVKVAVRLMKKGNRILSWLFQY